MVAEVGFEPRMTFWVILAYETRESQAGRLAYFSKLARSVGAAPTKLSFGDSAARAGALRVEIGSPGRVFTSNKPESKSGASDNSATGQSSTECGMWMCGVGNPVQNQNAECETRTRKQASCKSLVTRHRSLT